MDDPNITMEEYIRLEEEKARKRGKVFNSIAFDDRLTSGETLSCEPTVSSLNDEIDFKISFDDSDDEDYTEVFVSHAWRRLFGIRAPLVQEFLLEFFSTCRIRDEMGLDVVGTLCFQLGCARRSMTWRKFILALGLHTVEEMAEDGFGA
ncbi:hypothetical protein Tco_0755232 [Tanacetum coccineum]